MKTQELKRLAKKFNNFFDGSEEYNTVESQIRQFWFGEFGCNNSDRENELLEYWRNN